MATKTLSPDELPAFCQQLRERAGLTQQQLAEAIGQSDRRYVDNAERDPARIGAQRRIIEYFGGTVETVRVYRVTMPKNHKS